ncbi:hypothetical protein C8Q79DRAFT_466210 [Trametes meyenii]|nr:hypothetical protein C8Q79DRAFT_466210 [Trametes meyenii]
MSLHPSQNVTGPSPLSPLAGLPKPPALDNSFGAMLLGTSFGLMLYGLTVHQTYRYFRLYPRDTNLFKGIVLAILTMETLHSLIWMIACYHFLVTNYANASSLLTGHWQLNVAITGASNLICQGFYARRVYMLGTKNRWIVVVAVLTMTACLGFDVAASVEAFKLSLEDFPRFSVSWLVSAAYGCAVATDVLLTGALIRVLLRSRTGFKRTDLTLDTLIVYSINTGLLTSVTGLLVFVFALILPGNYIYAGISIVNAKLYANSVLAVLNSRRSLSSSAKVVDDFEMYPTNSSRSQRTHGTIPDTWPSHQVSVHFHPTGSASAASMKDVASPRPGTASAFDEHGARDAKLVMEFQPPAGV